MKMCKSLENTVYNFVHSSHTDGTQFLRDTMYIFFAIFGPKQVKEEKFLSKDNRFMVVLVFV